MQISHFPFLYTLICKFNLDVKFLCIALTSSTLCPSYNFSLLGFLPFKIAYSSFSSSSCPCLCFFPAYCFVLFSLSFLKITWWLSTDLKYYFLNHFSKAAFGSLFSLYPRLSPVSPSVCSCTPFSLCPFSKLDRDLTILSLQPYSTSTHYIPTEYLTFFRQQARSGKLRVCPLGVSLSLVRTDCIKRNGEYSLR